MSNTIPPSVHMLFELSFDPVVLVNQQGDIIDRNQTASHCFPENSYSHMKEMFHQDLDWKQLLDECQSLEQAIELQKTDFRLPNQSIVPCILRASMINDTGNENPLFTLSIAMGQSGLDAIQSFAQQNEKRVEKLSAQLTVMSKELLLKTNQLFEERNKVITIIQNMGDGLVACDREGIIIQCNEPASQLLHLEDDATGLPFVDACPSIALAVKLDPKSPEIKHPAELNLSYKHKELRILLSPVFDDSRNYTGFVFIIHDRTKQAEIDRMKTELISIVSHELRSPLTSIKGYVDLMQSGDFGKVPGEMESYLEVISDNANRLSALIEDMLDLSRIESGKLSMNFGKVDLQFLCDSVYLTMKPQAEQKKQTLIRNVETGLSVSGDVERLRQALTNLVSNAVKYTPDGGEIRIDAIQQHGEVWIQVIDNGYGIPEDQQPKLFQKFYRAKTRKTQHIGGTGLGLCITKSIAELHNGTITFTSEVDKGSTFIFTLPAYQN